jgi:acetyl-CoA carboxylase biotin carboxyl carrier protein
LEKRVTTIELRTEITGNVWKVLKAPGDRVNEGEEIVILESMKMEIPITASEAGVIREIRAHEGGTVTDGDVVATLDV